MSVCECAGSGMVLVESGEFIGESGVPRQSTRFVRICRCPAGWKKRQLLEMTPEERKKSAKEAKREEEEVPF